MAAVVAGEKAIDVVKKDSAAGGLDPRISSETFTKEICQEQDVESTSSYTMASQLSMDVDRWLRGASPIQSTGVQNSRHTLVQRSTLAASMASLGMSSMWYVMAMILPLFSMNINCAQWRCNSSLLNCAASTVFNSAEVLFAHVVAVCNSIRNHVRRLARDQVAREIFATAMDVVLLIYAVGFLVISMYQASIIC